jgi:hypothetical protein
MARLATYGAPVGVHPDTLETGRRQKIIAILAVFCKKIRE